jgi:hypothetical protein
MRKIAGVHVLTTPKPRRANLAAFMLARPLVTASTFLLRPALRVSPPIVANIAATQAAIELFQNVRTPATLIATALVPMGFGFPLVASLGNVDVGEERRLRLVKRLIVLIGFMSLASELLALCVSTNAINRLSQDAFVLESDESSTKTALDLLRKRPYSSFWVGTYTHFMFGVLGLLAIAALRVTVTVGAPYSTPVALLTGAVGLRIIATINRGLAVRDFGMGNFFVLCLNVARLTWTNAWRQRSVALLSRGLDPHPHP